MMKNDISSNSTDECSACECQQARLELYAKLAEVEAEIASGAKGEDFFVVAKKMREKLIEKLREAK